MSIDKIYTIYKIANKLNNKNYIGWTNKKLENRMKNHFYRARMNWNSHLYNAIRLHGEENFDCMEIYQIKGTNEDGKWLKDFMEEYFIIEYDSYNNGYNMTLGGEGTLGRIHSEETKKKISEKAKGNSRAKGRKLSDEQKIIIGLSSRGRKWSEKSKNSIRGRNNPCTEHAKIIHAKHAAKSWKFLDSKNNLLEIINLKQFCKDNNLKYSSMHRLGKGYTKRNNYKGFKLYNYS